MYATLTMIRFALSISMIVKRSDGRKHDMSGQWQCHFTHVSFLSSHFTERRIPKPRLTLSNLCMAFYRPTASVGLLCSFIHFCSAYGFKVISTICTNINKSWPLHSNKSHWHWCMDTLPASDKLDWFKRPTFHEPNLIPVRIDIIRAFNVFVWHFKTLSCKQHQYKSSRLADLMTG